MSTFVAVSNILFELAALSVFNDFWSFIAFCTSDFKTLPSFFKPVIVDKSTLLSLAKTSVCL
ncbi:hypothetical protein VQY18_02835 [Mycoplasma feriruminatoris]